MSTTQQAIPNRFYGALPDLNPNGGGTFIPPDEGWNELIFKIVREDDGQGNLLPVVREKVYQGQVKPGQYDIRLEFHINDPDSDVTPWKKWIGWTIGPKSNLRPILLAIRNDTPFPDGQSLNLAFLEKHENKPFRALITLDEVPSRNDPNETLIFANIVKTEAINKAKKGAKAAKAAPPPVANEEEDTFPEIPSW